MTAAECRRPLLIIGFALAATMAACRPSAKPGADAAVPAAGGPAPSECAPGSTCICEIASGCEKSCAIGASCSFECRGPGTCKFACPGGRCSALGRGASMELACAGGDCKLTCDGPGSCKLTECKKDCELYCRGEGPCESTCQDPSCKREVVDLSAEPPAGDEHDHAHH